MKTAIFTSAAIATLSTFVGAQSTLDNTNCWMQLGQYTTGGAFCVKPLPDFTDISGCMASQATCVQEYNDCKTNTISTSACLVLMSRCQILNTFCNSYCTPDSSGNTPCNCNLSTANGWNGVDTLTTASCATSSSVAALTVNNQQAQTPISTAAPIVSAPAVVAPVATSTAAALIAPDVPCGQCFIDGSNGKRGFENGPHYAPSGQRMTIGLCMSICQGLNYKYTGVEFSQECWCGNSFLNGAMPTAGTACTMTCQGDSTQTCGGNLLMNIYQSGCATPTVAAKSTAAAQYTAAAAYNAKSTTAAVYNNNNNQYQTSTPVAAYAAQSTAAAYNYQASTAAAYQQASTPVVNYNAYTAAAAYTKPVAVNSYVAYTPTVGICSIPTAYATPIGGIHAPVVACNDGTDYTTKPWKQYNSHYTSTCPVYYIGWEANACTESCTTQYNNCIANYANTFKTYSSTSAYKIRRGLSASKEKRTYGYSWWPSYGGSTTTVTYGSGTQYAAKDTLSSATAKCYAQYDACWTANRYLATPKGTCSAGGVYHAPSTQYGYTTYNAGTKSYGSYTGNSYAQSNSNTYGGSTSNSYGYWKE